MDFENKEGDALFTYLHCARGLSHAADGRDNDDAAALCPVEKGSSVLYMAAFDGVSNSRHGGEGARILVEGTHIFLESTYAETEDGRQQEAALRASLAAANKHCKENALWEYDRPFDYATTAALCLFDSERKMAIVGLSGDSGILLMDKSGAISCTQPQKGPDGGTYVVQHGPKTWEFNIYQDICAVISATDGVFDVLTVADADGDLVTPSPDALQVFRLIMDPDADAATTLDRAFAERLAFASGISDDTTLVAAALPGAVPLEAIHIPTPKPTLTAEPMNSFDTNEESSGKKHDEQSEGLSEKLISFFAGPKEPKAGKHAATRHRTKIEDRH